MGVSNTVVGQVFTGDGANRTFAIPFAFIPGDFNSIKVYTLDAAGVKTLVGAADYELTPSGPTPANVYFDVAPVNLQKILLERNLPLTQIANYINDGPFKNEDHEKVLNRLTMMVQQLAYSQGLYPNTLDKGTLNLELEKLSENCVLTVNGDKTKIVMGPTYMEIEGWKDDAEAAAAAAAVSEAAAAASALAASNSATAANNSKNAAAASAVAALTSEQNADLSEAAAAAYAGMVAAQGVVIITTSVRNPSHNGKWILSNATYDTANDQFNRIDVSKPAFGINMRSNDNVPYEANTKGICIWVASPAANPINNTYGAVGGWQNVFIVTEFKDMVIGGYGIEIDGNGISPYGRLVLSAQSAKNWFGLLTNAFLDYSDTDDHAKPSWRVAVNQTDDYFAISRAPATAGAPAFTELLKIDNAGVLTFGGTLSFLDNAFSISDNVDATKKIDFNAGGTTNTKTTITAAQTANRVITLPDATDTLMGKATSDFMSNKTFTFPILYDVFSVVNQALDPATPSSGYQNLYGKAGGIYRKDSNGNVLQLADRGALPAAKTANYTLTVADELVRGDASGGAFTFTFPNASGLAGKVLTVMKTDTTFNKITLTGTGMTGNKLCTVGEIASYISDGTNWIQRYRKTDTPWIQHTGTYNAFGTVSNNNAWWRRTGNACQMRGRFSAGTTQGNTAGVYLPTGMGNMTNTGGNESHCGEFMNINTPSRYSMYAYDGLNMIYLCTANTFTNVLANAVASSTQVLSYRTDPIGIVDWEA